MATDEEKEAFWAAADADTRPTKPPQDEAMLGLATTEELFRELIARFTVPAYRVANALVLAEMLGGLSSNEREYRPVD